MSFFEDLLRTLRAPLDFVRGKTGAVRGAEGRVQGNINRIRNLPHELRGEIAYNKNLANEYKNRATNAKNYVQGKPMSTGKPGDAAFVPDKGGKKMGLFSKKRRCPGCGEKLDARWELCPFCGFGGDAGAPSNQQQQGGPPRTQALDIGNNNYGNQGQHGGAPRTMALDVSGGGGGNAQRGNLVAWIIPLDGPQGGQLLELRGRAVVGSAPDCDVVVKDPSVSGRHAEFSSQGGIVRVNDLGSTNGTFVNEKRVQNAELVDGDTLRLGRTPFKFKST